MTTPPGPKSTPSIGFMTVTRDADQTLYGGFLVLSPVGRPLEFHCTAPVRPSRAQQILYGPALAPYLYGERIGQSLIAAVREPPAFVVTDRLPSMAARPLVQCPMLLLERADNERAAHEVRTDDSSPGRACRVDSRHSSPAPHWVRLERFRLDQYSVAVSAGHANDRSLVTEQWPYFAEQLDLREPFQRIREAIEEARGGA